MTQILLVAHAPLASAFLAVAQHVFPERRADMLAIDAAAHDEPQQLEQAIRSALRTLVGDATAQRTAQGTDQGTDLGTDQATPAPEVLLLVDVFGATPCNAALAAADGFPVRVVTGLSVPMLWRVLGYANKSLDELVVSAVAGAAQGAFHAAVSRRQNQGALSSPHDPDHHHHQ